MSDTSLIAEAKAHLDIPALWRLRGWPGDPGVPGKDCLRPYAPEDRRKSGSVLPDGQRFHDFKTSESFDAPGLLGKVECLENGEACRLFIELAGVKPSGEPRRRAKMGRPRPTVPARIEEKVRTKPKVPPLTSPEPSALDVIGELREIGPMGPALAARRGLLFLAEWHRKPCWVVTDSERWNLRFRRMDGREFRGARGSVKAVCSPGSWASWPIGIADLEHRINVILVEGEGDFLAAHHFIVSEGVQDTTSAVCMSGSGGRIPREALPSFRGKRVRIFPHLDSSDVGFAAAVRWETQLQAAGVARVECFDLGGLVTSVGEAVKDLNDLALMADADLKALGAIVRF